MKKIQHDNIRSIAVKQDALDDIYAHFDEFHKTTVWQEECRSWFKDGKKKNRIYLWPGPVSQRQHVAQLLFSKHLLANLEPFLHRRFTSSRVSRTPDSKTTTSDTDSIIDLRSWDTARSRPIPPTTYLG